MKTERNLLVSLLLACAVLAFCLPAAAQVTLVSTGSVWKYLDNGSDQGTAWRDPGYPDGNWLSGPAELGFGDGGEATTNQAGHIAYYYRLTFNVPNSGVYTNLRVRLKRDDGALVYLNNVEVVRDNMPAGSIGFETLATATAADDGGTFFPYSFGSAGVLQDGDNVLAVEVHQSATTSSDVSFDLELVGNPLPSIAITSPTNNQTIAASTVSIAGTAIPGGSNVTLVEISQGGNVVGTASGANFTVPWQNVTPGAYTLVAKVTDSAGLLATSAPVNITVQAPPASMLIARNSQWKYHNLGQDLGTAWLALNYDDSEANGWTNAIAPLGDNVQSAVQQITLFGGTVIGIGPSGARYPTLYFRKVVNVSNRGAYQGLTLRVQRDDAAFIYLNGQYLTNSGCSGDTRGDAPTLPHTSYCCVGQGAVDGAEEITYYEYRVPASALVDGPNVFCVEGRQQAIGSSDLQFDLEVEGTIDTQGPYIVATEPTAGSIVQDLRFVDVVFDDAVQGVNASDLLINTEPATNLVVVTPREYQFFFASPNTGTVQVAWALNHGITDNSGNAFDGSAGWTYNYTTNIVRPSVVVISEFMANNNVGIRDEDNSREDWIELRNTNPNDPVDISGWYLTDDTNNLTKWQFPPGVVLQPNSYRVNGLALPGGIIWASAKDRRDSTKPLHTNFRLSNNDPGSPPADYLALVDANTNIISEYYPAYPPQQADISYGRDTVDATVIGFYSSPTPGAQNSSGGSGFMAPPVFSFESGIYTNNSITVTITGPANGTIRYTTDGSNPTNTSAIYSSALNISTNATVKARVYPPGGTNLLPSAVIAKTYIMLDSSLWTFNSNLPILILDSHAITIPIEIPPGGARAKGTFASFDTVGGRASLLQRPEFIGPAEFENVGQSSRDWPKHPYSIEIQDAVGNDDAHSILGLPAEADWKLRTPWTDKFLMGDFLAYEQFEQMGHYSCRRRFAEIFVHTGSGKLTANDYGGIEVFLEKIEIGGDRVDLQKLSATVTNQNDPNISGGYIFKRDKTSVGDLDFATTGASGFPGIPLKYHDPKPREFNNNASHPQALWLKNFLSTMEQKLYASTWLTAQGTNHYSYYLDVDGFADQFWIVEFPKQIDGYRLSDFFSKDRNGKVAPVPIWDWNLAYGNANYADGGHVASWYWPLTGFQDHPWARRLITGNQGVTGIGDPDFCQRIADRWGVLRTNVMNGPRVLSRIDELHATLTEAANRPAPLGDFTKPAFARLGRYDWPNPDGALGGGTTYNWDVDYQNPTTYAGIVAQMKKWVLGRYNWIETQFLPPPTLSRPGGMVTDGTTVTMTVPVGATNWYTMDGTDPRASGGGIAAGAQKYTGPITINGNTRIVARSLKANGSTFQNTWGAPAAETYFSSVRPLRITEIMYHPAKADIGNTNDADNFEYVEVQNTGNTPLNLSSFSLGGGITFNFPPVTLNPGQRGVVVANLAAFQLRYGTNDPNILVLGVYTGNLDNGGDHLVLSGPLKEPILDFSYSDNWHKATDGAGFSLVFANNPTNAPLSNWGSASGWRASTAIGSSPGTGDATAPFLAGIVINEVLSYGTGPDTVELYNPTLSPVNIGGWFLTDDYENPRQFIIPNTNIQAQSYVTFNTNFFGSGTNGFAFGGKGDQVYLFSGDAVNLTGYAHGFDFGASDFNVTFGRHVISTGDDHMVAQTANTLGGANSGPRVGPIVISEIMYHPPDTLVATNAGGSGFVGTLNNAADEYIELQNITGISVALFDATRPTNTWHIRDGVDFDFPPNISIGPNAFAIIVGFNPAIDSATSNSFRQRFAIPANVPIYGPWSGQLDNGGEAVELRKPRANDTNAEVPYVLVERVNYNDKAPWPTGADGLGLSLQRRGLGIYGNEPTNWTAVAATPGSNPVLGGTPPTITSQPGDQLVVAADTGTFTATASGTGVRFQWTYYGNIMPGATNSTLVINNFQLEYAGVYNVIVHNGAGYAFGTNFNVTSRVLLRITGQPGDRNVTAGSTTNFTLSAVGQGVLRYQWYFNGNVISAATNPTATNATLTLTNIQSPNAGSYYATVRDDFELTNTVAVSLGVFTPPGIALQPLSVTTVEGGSATFTAMGNGSMPMFFRWRTNAIGAGAVVVATLPSSTNYGSITFANLPVFLGSSGNPTSILVSLVITNFVGQSPISQNARLTVLPDSDHDGLPDEWEDTHPGFNKNDPSDGNGDADGDKMLSRDEYIAGTDPTNATSYLKIQFAGGSGNVLQFNAVTNRSYSVVYKDNLLAPTWTKLPNSDVLQRNVNRLETINDNSGRSNRFYKLVIPIRP